MSALIANLSAIDSPMSTALNSVSMVLSFADGCVKNTHRKPKGRAAISAAMHPSGPAAQSLRTRSGFSLPFLSVAGPVHGGFFHSHDSKSSSHASTSAARVKQRTSSAWTAASAHSSSFIKSSLRFVVDAFTFSAH